jgi:hypothetical protein
LHKGEQTFIKDLEGLSILLKEAKTAKAQIKKYKKVDFYIF